MVHTVGDLREKLSLWSDHQLIPFNLEIVTKVGDVYLPLDYVTAKHLILVSDREQKPSLVMVVDVTSFGPQV